MRLKKKKWLILIFCKQPSIFYSGQLCDKRRVINFLQPSHDLSFTLKIIIVLKVALTLLMLVWTSVISLLVLSLHFLSSHVTHIMWMMQRHDITRPRASLDFPMCVLWPQATVWDSHLPLYILSWQNGLIKSPIWW